MRGQALAIREMLFVEAARATGGGPLWIIRRHIWPGVLPVVAAQFATSVSFAIFTSASLSFLGLGIPPPAADWGGMVRAGYDYLAINPWMSLGAGGGGQPDRDGVLRDRTLIQIRGGKMKGIGRREMLAGMAGGVLAASRAGRNAVARWYADRWPVE